MEGKTNMPKNKFHTLNWLLVALLLSAAKPNFNMKVAASAYLSNERIKYKSQISMVIQTCRHTDIILT